MGCVSSKLVAEDANGIGDHFVSLTSTTYGFLTLDTQPQITHNHDKIKESVKKSPSPRREDPPHEIINAWELMEDLEDEVSAAFQSKRWRLFDAKSPFKKVGSPRKRRAVNGSRSLENSPQTVLKDSTNLKKPSPRLWAKRSESLRFDLKRRSLGPLFDPKRDEEDKGMCPPGGENAVIIYTTTLRGIRKTFEDCNVARSTIESHNVEVCERDISMHSAFKEELRDVMRSKDVRVPAVFVKGRFVGGADEVVKLEEEGKLGILLSGIPKAAAAGCKGCGGVRFVMCVECSGSCKVFDGEKKKSSKCSKCNENGLILCPFCCSV